MRRFELELEHIKPSPRGHIYLQYMLRCALTGATFDRVHDALGEMRSRSRLIVRAQGRGANCRLSAAAAARFSDARRERRVSGICA